MTTLILPVSSDGSRTFTTSIGDKSFRFRTYFNRLDGWYIDIFDELENVVVLGVALNRGLNILRQFTGIIFEHELTYKTLDGTEGDQPEDLGLVGYPLVKVNA